MRTAISCSYNNSKKFIVSELRNCDNIIICNASNDKFKILDNPNKNNSHLFFNMSIFLENNITFLITNEVNPKLKRDLTFLGINIIETEKMSAEDAYSTVLKIEKEVI